MLTFHNRLGQYWPTHHKEKHMETKHLIQKDRTKVGLTQGQGHRQGQRFSLFFKHRTTYNKIKIFSTPYYLFLGE